MAARVARGDVRLYRFAPPDKKRPVVSCSRRDSAIAYLATVTVAPITSTVRGVPSEVLLTEEDGMKTSCAVNLHNVGTFSGPAGQAHRPAQLHAHQTKSAPLYASRWAAISFNRSRRMRVTYFIAAPTAFGYNCAVSRQRKERP